ncbi:MAG: histidine kinase, partial [Blautia sp.]|nr:histidine kinase [Blautia sp.]
MTIACFLGAARGTYAKGLNASGNENVKLLVDPIENEESFSAILYDNRNGLPTSEANAIAQTKEGFIWIGSYAGLIRYDGNTFERIESDLGILNTRCLYVDREERLWIGTNDFGLFLMDKGEIVRVDQPDELPSLSIRSIVESPEGTMYVGSAAGVFTVDKDLHVTVNHDERLLVKAVMDLRAGEDGLIYGNTFDGDLFVLKEGEVLSYYHHDDFHVDGIYAILPDPVRPGYLYLAAEDAKTRSARLFHGTLEDLLVSAEVIDITPLSAVERLECLEGEIWICAGNGVGKWGSEGLKLLKNVPMDNTVGHVMTDEAGNLWFTSSRQCVMKIVPNQFLDLFGRYGLKEDVVNSTCLLDNRFFLGTDNCGLLVLKEGKPLISLPLKRAVTASGEDLGATNLIEYLKNERIRCVYRDSRDRLWICTWRHQQGLLRYDRGELVAFTKKDGLLSNQVRTVSECEDGKILVAQLDGLSIIEGEKVLGSYSAQDGLTVTSILTLTEGFHKEYLLGSDGGGIYVLKDGSIKQHIGLKEGLQSEVILRIKKSRHQDMYWIATGNSLAFMTPDYQVTTVRHFPFSNNYDFYESNRGDLWVLSSN